MVRRQTLFAVLVVAACGGGKGASESRAPVHVDDVDSEIAEGSDGDTVVAPERMDEIKALLDRKRVVVARCLPDAIDAGKAEKNARGRITFEFVITAAGKAQSIKVAEATLDSEMVQDCTKQHIASIDFGALPRSLEWSYTYSFEAY
jgi:hypothetical protein